MSARIERTVILYGSDPAPVKAISLRAGPLSMSFDPETAFVRRLMLELRREGRAVLFSSHELSEVEMVCDRVAMINGGRVIVMGTLDEILKPYRFWRARVRTAQIERLREACAASAAAVVEGGSVEAEVDSYVIVARTIEALPALLQGIVEAGALLEDVDHGYESLERLYAEIVEGT